MDEQDQMTYIELHRKYFDKLVMWCMNYVNNDPDLRPQTEDWVQEAFYRAVKNKKKFLAHKNKYGWFLITCKHIADSAMQRKGVRHRHTAIYLNAPYAPSITDTISNIDAWMDREESRAIINRVLSSLTPTELEIFHEVFVGEEKAEDVAKRKGKPLSTIKATIRRIRRKARKIRKIFRANYFLLLVVSFLSLCS